MIKPILYTEVEEKNELGKELAATFTPTQRLIYCLDLMDMMAKMRHVEIADKVEIADNNESKVIKWVVLNSGIA
jgi:hypothetical protein